MDEPKKSKYDSKVDVVCIDCRKIYQINYRSLRKKEIDGIEIRCLSCSLIVSHKAGKFANRSHRKHNSEETKAKIGAKSKAMWDKPGHREHMSKHFTEAYNTDEHRAAASIRSKKWFMNKENKDKWISALLDVMTSDEMREKLSKSSKKLWADPEYRELIVSRMKERTDELKQKISDNSKALWKDDGYRTKTLNGMLMKVWNDPVVKVKLSEATSKLWQNDDYKLSVSESISKAIKDTWKKQSYRDKMAKAMIKRWANEDYRTTMAKHRSSATDKVSYIQELLYKYLDDLGVSYFKEGPETRVGFYVFDCLVNTNNEKKLLIECQGNYWHSFDSAQRNDKAKFTYINKYFPDHEIMYIWEHEFYNKDGVLDRLKLKLGLSVDCVDFCFGDVAIRDVGGSDVKSFLDAYHYIGKGRGGRCFGAYLGGVLIGCCVFSSPLRQNMDGRFGGDFRELSRFCIHPGYHKKNFASWFIGRCVRLVGCRVVAYADTTVGHVGTIYRASNFRLSHVVPSDYWYVDVDGYVMHKRTLYGKARSLKLSEGEFAERFGFVRRYGGEKLCFVFG